MTNRFLTRLIAILVLAVAWTTTALCQESAVRMASKQCLGCHDSGPDSPPYYLMEGSHGGDVGGSGNVQGCPACHGSSQNHLSDPEQNSPDVSFGPRWGAGAATQDAACLACHEENTTVQWRNSLHMLNNVTCITCHDIHTDGDEVLFPARQAGVCTLCHETQKAGIHGTDDSVDPDPPCSDCHNPHDHESAESEMLKNDSMGCRACHNLERMAESNTVSDRSKRYHRVMSQPHHTCLECHQGIAHVPPDFRMD